MADEDLIIPHAVWRRAGAAMRDGAGALASTLVRLAMPPRCLACEAPVAGEGALCTACWSRFSLIERPYCERLGVPFAYDPGPGALSPEAIADPPPFRRLRAVALYDAVARQLVHGLKYRDRLDLAGWMARWMVRAGRDVIDDAEIIVPVPLHPVRLWWRRFNQSAALAGVIGAAAEKPVAMEAIRRVKATRRQVGLRQTERAENVRGAFRVDPAEAATIRGRRVLVIDDVYTTGATAKAVTRALDRAGATSVDILVFARVADGPV